ncbi:hypothetical protein AQUCO_00900723v1 [Aquilegia coerulea]|uniref:Late embryogenesis abundant protein LEA-2 subgroup domain-containing protein n=1 Tax=Aquilegia coerulea TaxID=218851 RepID=A0A2G5EF31_AQUCA|nr:hypothetical protein AQUCO_00900723v1 [Aquilegia coerulea]
MESANNHSITGNPYPPPTQPAGYSQQPTENNSSGNLPYPPPPPPGYGQPTDNDSTENPLYPPPPPPGYGQPTDNHSTGNHPYPPPTQPGYIQPTDNHSTGNLPYPPPTQPGYSQPTDNHSTGNPPNYPPPMQSGYGQPTDNHSTGNPYPPLTQPGYGQPTDNHSTGNPYPPPMQPGYGQPTQPGYGQPTQPAYGQPTQPGYGQIVQTIYGQPMHPGYNPNGYPYGGGAAAAAPANYYSTNVYPPKKSSYGRRPRYGSWVCCFIVGMISLFVLSSFITLMIWLFFRPAWPEFRVDSASAYGFNLNLDMSKLNGKLEFGLKVRNPNNKYAIAFQPLTTVIMYKHLPISYLKINAFHQETGNETTIPLHFVAPDITVPYISRTQPHDQIHLDLLATGWIKYRSPSWNTRPYWIRAYCRSLTVRMSSNNTKPDGDALLSGQNTCKVSSNLLIF